MKKELHTITLPEGRFSTELIILEQSDRPNLFKLYNLWRELSRLSTEFKGRSINLPEALSEGAFALEMNVARVVGSIPGANSSFDCYSLANKKRIQVKACSVLPDLTSFGPDSQWDELYFCDFFKSGRWDGSFDIYLINNDDIYDHKVNASQTLREQQKQGRRPRFSIYKDIVTRKKMRPIKTGRLN